MPHLQANGWYTLSNPTRSNVVLGWNRVDQAPVFVSTTSGSAAQREWQFVRQSNGSYEIRSRDGGEKLNFFEHNNGVVVAPPTVTGGSVQWFISPIGGALVNGAHYFFSWRANPQYALNVDSAPAATIGANAVLARAFANPTQWWRVEYNSVYGMYQVRNLNNLNAVLEWNVTTNRAVLGGSRGTWEQLWMVRPGLNGGWELINLAHGGVRALDNNNSVSGDAAVNVTTYTGSAGQEWGLSAPQR